MEIRETFSHFWQGFSLFHRSSKKKTAYEDKAVRRHRQKWRSFLKKHWGYVLAFIGAFLLSLLIAR